MRNRVASSWVSTDGSSIGQEFNDSKNKYSKVLCQVVKAKGVQGGLLEVGDRLEKMIAAYDDNDQTAHNAHTVMLKQYHKFLTGEEKIKRKEN